LEFINDPDPEIVKGVIAAMTSIFGRLSKESQFDLVPVIKEKIEKVAIVSCQNEISADELANGHPHGQLYVKKVANI